MPALSALRIAAVIVAVSACGDDDTSSASTLTSTGGAAPGGGGQGASGAGGEGAGGDDTNTSAGGGGASQGGSSEGGGPPCSEEPCKLVAPQCGCEDDEQCSIFSDGPGCTARGDVPLGAICSPDDRCAPGLYCASKSPTLSTCIEFCESDLECTAPGGLCNVHFNDMNGMEIPGAAACTESCDPVTNDGCDAEGTGCQVRRESGGGDRFYTTCRASGAGFQGDACGNGTACAPTFGCFSSGGSNTCFQYCDMAAPDCPDPLTCKTLVLGGDPAVIGETNLGLCSPP